jgi:hypothetical protein
MAELFPCNDAGQTEMHIAESLILKARPFEIKIARAVIAQSV